MNEELVIFIGDDTGGTFGRKLQFTISVDEGTSLDGCSAEFVFDGIKRTFAGPLVDGETREIVYSAEETAQMAKGVRYASFRVIDANGKVRTFTNTIRVRCTDIVAEVYPGTSGISITIGGGSVAWNDITGKPNFAPVATSGSYDDLTDKPSIPSPVTVDSALSDTSTNPVQNKVIATALKTGYTDWTFSSVPALDVSFTLFEHEPGHFTLTCHDQSGEIVGDAFASATDPVELNFTVVLASGSLAVTATRTRITPKKTSQLTNDGDGTSAFATVAQVASKANSADVAAALALKADASSLPYALVDVTIENTLYLPDSAFPITYYSTSQQKNVTCTGMDDGVDIFFDGVAGYEMDVGGDMVAHFLSDGSFDGTMGDAENLLFNGQSSATLSFANTATLADRAINAVSLSSAATLVMPAANAGHARDFVVRLTLTETGGTVPSVTFPADVAYETEGGKWPDLTEAGTYIVRLTEVPKASELETARFFLQCSSAVSDATPPSAGGAA